MSLEIKFDVLRAELERLKLQEELQVLDLAYKQEIDYYKVSHSSFNEIHSDDNQKDTCQRYVFFHLLRLCIEEHLIKKFAWDNPEE